MTDTSSSMTVYRQAARSETLPHGYAQQYMLLSKVCIELASVIVARHTDIKVEPTFNNIRKNSFECFPNGLLITDPVSQERIASLIIYPAGEIGPERIDMLDAAGDKLASYKLLLGGQKNFDQARMAELTNDLISMTCFHDDKKKVVRAASVLVL